jgi:hypothetical protein
MFGFTSKIVVKSSKLPVFAFFCLHSQRIEKIPGSFAKSLHELRLAAPARSCSAGPNPSADGKTAAGPSHLTAQALVVLGHDKLHHEKLFLREKKEATRTKS